MGETVDETLRVEIVGSLTLLTLARSRALNALTEHMRAKLSEALWSGARDPQVYAVAIQSESPRAFSTGSDVREVIQLARSDLARGRKAFADEYALNWQCECFSKPTVSLINGLAMGGGIGISLYGTHRVAGEGYSFAMPETQIGLFPDVGVCHALSRMSDHVGMYLGLTGRSIGRAEAYALGLVTHCIDASEFEAIKTALADTWPVDTVLDERHREPGAGELLPCRALIADCFSEPSVEAILARLEAVSGAHRDWAQEVVADLRRRSPVSLKITHRHIRESRGRDLRQTLIADYRIAAHILAADGDFYEGVRAMLIDKDGPPRWSPQRIEDVSDEMLDRYFASLDADEMPLPTREEMQAARA
ncbi:enoyl-CoA hydratase/isomerase family protein [Hyphomicrobium sp. CS1GBMeth3]|uniref:enoyl-CoA hydratase/isomerase family protein n=1 Tax=Hyphomicrobium sp. CS1GBMeth3 TaxID=1892845 RepID=UPI000930885D|nr:enoyl-CoA hydratase/isomerase family protein [Hyphomicrobium sp. CS1GBMeth3]